MLLSPLVLMVVIGADLPAQGPPPVAVDPRTKVAHAVRLAGAPPRLDGRLDDAVWAQAAFFSDFVQKEPVEGAEPTERTEIGILYDDEALYVGVRAYADDPRAIQRTVGRRDGSGLTQSEHVWISLDTYRDRRTAYSFGVTASGVRMDWFHPRDHEFALDLTYDPVWEARAVVDSLGWSAEMRIPFSQLRFRDQDEQVWGLNVDRWIPSRNEDVFWVPVPRNATGWSSRMGTLVGIRGIRPGRRLELLPYAASSATLTPGADPRDPFNPDGRAAELRAGADVKLGLGSHATLEATVNPDFGQVEADPAVVNLSAFETFFDERRPFFTERRDLFRSAGPNLFYSRRIGARPPGAAAGDYVDRPGASTILGAGKLTGRFGSGFSLGALAAVTARETARTFDTASARAGEVEIAPPAGYAVVRVQREFGPHGSTVGLMATAVGRHVRGALVEVLARQAYASSLDWNLRFRGGEYEFGGWAAFSRVAGDSTVILAQQRASRRYYQRPDQGYVRLDSSRTTLSGYAAGLYGGRRSGRHWLWDVSLGAESPGYEINDLGRIVTADGLSAFASLTYRETRPGRLFRDYRISLNGGGEWNYGGVRQFSHTSVDVSVTWRNQWGTFATLLVEPRGQDMRLTRGGPSMGRPRGWITFWTVRSNFAASSSWNLRAAYGTNEDGGLHYRLSGGLTLRPAPRWSLSVSPGYLHDRNVRQYVDAFPDPQAAATYGVRYVFATVALSQWSAPLRLNYAFTPDLTLELYGEPFIASGRYARHGELDRPGSRRLLVYGEDLPVPPSVTLPASDFTVASFRSNAVLRWEWRRGSTLFLVWQQNRGASSGSARPVRPGDLFDGLGAPGDTFLAVKLTYWLAVD
jgi:hypothetical protein